MHVLHLRDLAEHHVGTASAELGSFDIPACCRRRQRHRHVFSGTATTCAELPSALLCELPDKHSCLPLGLHIVLP